MKRALSVFMFVLLLVSMLTFSFTIQDVKASGTIYIRADGSIEPPSAPIQRSGDLYVLLDNITSDSVGIVIERNNIFLDGAGFTLSGTGAYLSKGIDISLRSNITIENTKITSFQHGIYTYPLLVNSTLLDNTITDNDVGIWLSVSSFNTISGNNITPYNWNSYGVELIYSSNNSIVGNSITNNGVGISLLESSNNTISGNNVTNSLSYGIYAYSSSNNNKLFRNNFINNAQQVLSTDSANVWNNRYMNSGGGNYWSDYNGSDLFLGEFQNETGSDGIGDIPYTIDTSNQDNYPLMRPYVPFENQTIYIKSDGSVDPSGAPIQRSGDIYTITSSIFSDADGIIVQKDNVTIDGAGWTVQRTGTPEGSVGIDVSERNYATLKNTGIIGFGAGIQLASSFGNSVLGNNITDNEWGLFLLQSPNNSIVGNVFLNDGLCVSGSLTCGNVVSGNLVNGKPLVYLEGVTGHVVNDAGQVVLVSCDEITVENLNLSNTDVGIQLARTNNSRLSGNSMAHNTLAGIYLMHSSNNTLIGNNVTTNERGGFGIAIRFSPNNSLSDNAMQGRWSFEVHGNSLGDYLQSVDTSNLLDGKPIYYFMNQSDIVVNDYVYPSVGYLGFVNCANVTVQGMDLTNNVKGLLLANTTSSKIADNNFIHNLYGIWLFSSPNNSIFHNSFINNTRQADSVGYNNTWDDGYPSGGNYWGEYNVTDLCSGAYQNETGSDNIGDVPYEVLTGCTDRYPLMGPWTAQGQNITVTHASGISMTFEDVAMSGITTVAKNSTGPESPSGFKLALEQPTYYDIKTTASHSGTIKINISYNDTGLSPEEENGLELVHWDEAEQQWVDTTTYVDTHNNLVYGETSHLSTFTIITPLIHNIAITNAPPSKTVVGQGFSTSNHVTIKNWDFTETFNVTAYANTTVIGSENVTLPAGNSTTITLTWNTTGFAYGNYTISAYAWPVPGETDTADNNFTGGWVIVSMVGDITGPGSWPDGKVDVRDVARVARNFGQTVPPAPPNCDITGPTQGVPDGKIDVRDISLVARHFGEVAP